ncbi:MAG: hypothetical protein ACKVIW_04725, partial [bacterium]
VLTATATTPAREEEIMYRHYSWEHSYFSGKTRGYLRFKERAGALGPGFEDILATPDLIAGRLLVRSQSNTIPQLEAPDGTWIQDTSEIIDFVEAAHPSTPVVADPAHSPRQALASYLIELLADEWLLVPGFWERWFFSEDDRKPSHRGYNEQQWGAVLAAGQNGHTRRAVGGAFFEQAFGISTARTDPKGVYDGLVQLGCTLETEHAWQTSQHNVLGILENHFAEHDYVFGGRPALADFGLLGPLYAHIYRDAISGFALRTYFPITSEWVERTNGEGSLNARTWNQKLYSLDDDGELVARPATSNGGEWLGDDAIPETLAPLIGVFFEEMWPVLTSTIERLSTFMASDDHTLGERLPEKSFTASPGFFKQQTGDGALTHEFEIGGIKARRMVSAYQVWMLTRIADLLDKCFAGDGGRESLASWLEQFPRGAELLDLRDLLATCPVEKRGGLIFSVAAA